MIRVLVAVPLVDDEIPQDTLSINTVLFEGQNLMALYYRSWPIPDLPNVVNIYDSET